MASFFKDTLAIPLVRTSMMWRSAWLLSSRKILPSLNTIFQKFRLGFHSSSSKTSTLRLVAGFKPWFLCESIWSTIRYLLN